jgi:DNA (cytosine-5)-methyltransferase 1
MGELLVRNVPHTLRSWIEEQRQQHCMTQQELVLSVLEQAYERHLAEAMPLFARVPPLDPLPAEQIPFTFTDLFAGVGGFRIALEKLGGRCVFSCEWDKYAQKTYRTWFGETPRGDIRKLKPREIPDHDVLAGGFPCQPFSIAGVSKKKSLGHPHGFKCESQGNLFFHLATIAAAKRPPILFLENVKNLQSHDKGRTWDVILRALDDIEYKVFSKVLDAAAWVPQHRERIYIVCFDKRVFGNDPPFEFPKQTDGPRPKLEDVLETKVDKRYTLSAHLWNYLQEYAEKHKAKGNGFGYGLGDPQGTTRTLSARYFKDGSEILIPQSGDNPRRLTPRECARLMGFDDRYKIVVSDTQAYRQFGNAVVPKVVEAVGRQILKVLAWQLARTKNGCLLKEVTSKQSVTLSRARKGHDGVSGSRTRHRRRNQTRQRDTQVHLAK